MSQLKQILILTIIILGFACVNVSGQGKIRIFSENKDSINAYHLSEFYFVHHIFADAFFLTDLYNQFGK
jgi:hypothetical protein